VRFWFPGTMRDRVITR